MEFDKSRANIELNNIIMNILTQEMPALKEKIKKLCLELKRAKYLIYIFSSALFAVGLFFLIVALSIAFHTNTIADTLKTLGFGGASATSFVSLMLINPIERIRDANFNASQAEMIYNFWELAILLYIRAMDIDDRESIKETAEKIREATATAIKLLEKYVEEKD
ncbi:MAG: hypothetical protein DRN11_01500 [Thermoplasmata archaeon]|nr:MAG: hypothetical protein DRN11_01500 [Thermoplasmata archaeon]HDN96107.1 hypothetical protein [Thermoplasmatales archaeon]